MSNTAEPPKAHPPLLTRVSVKLGLVVLAATCALAFTATLVFTHRLENAYHDAGRAQLESIASTWDDGFRITSLNNPRRLGRRVARLRELNQTIHKISVSWRLPDKDTLMVQDGHEHDLNGVKRDVSTTAPIHLEGSDPKAPINQGGQRYHEVHAADGAHYAEIQEPIRRGGKTIAMLELHYDLAGLDAALAEDERTVTVAAMLAAITLTLLANLLLARTLLSPLQRLRAAAKRLGAGDRRHRLDWRRRDEIGLLAEDFDRMAAELDSVHGHLEALALTDPLTGLLNHRAFQERLEQELRRAERERYGIAVVALDVDNFKEINDRWGHAAGDEGLRVLSQVFRTHLRPHDVSGRVGGDEFCLAIVRSSAEAAEEVVDRLREHISHVEVGPAGQQIRISAGISEFPRHSLSREELMHLADGAMYWAKSSGRDRTCIYSSDNPFAMSPEERAAQAAHEGLVNTVHALAKAVDAKDAYTNMHSQRVGRYAATIARRLGFDEAAIESIRTAGVLHDVGKIGISDAILRNAGSLSAEEAAIMRKHSELGHDIIAGAGMFEIAEHVLYLHERWDGRGYPHGVAGEAIPLASRILHVADALEAMTSSRVYRDAMPVADAVAEIQRVSGTQVDPTVADALFAVIRDGELEVGDHEEVDADCGPALDASALELLTGLTPGELAEEPR